MLKFSIILAGLFATETLNFTSVDLVGEEGLDVEVEHALDDGEDGEGDGQHRDAGQAGHTAQVVLRPSFLNEKKKKFEDEQ